jgi:polyisoprenoid-binding protein YceI
VTARQALVAATLVLPLSLAALAEGTATPYYFGSNESRTLLQFESETSVETIHGLSRAMSGTASFDFDKGEGSVDFKVPVKKLDTGMAARNEHLFSDGWLDAEKFPDILFKAKSLKRTATDEKTKKETWSFDGEFTIHGVTKALKGEASVQRIPEDLGKKLGRGNWVKVKTEFQITLKDFDIVVPEVAAAKVSPVWDCKVDIFGTTEAPKDPAPKAEEKKAE